MRGNLYKILDINSYTHLILVCVRVYAKNMMKNFGRVSLKKKLNNFLKIFLGNFNSLKKENQPFHWFRRLAWPRRCWSHPKWGWFWGRGASYCCEIGLGGRFRSECRGGWYLRGDGWASWVCRDLWKKRGQMGGWWCEGWRWWRWLCCSHWRHPAEGESVIRSLGVTYEKMS